jgi:hypothetical protein
MTDVLPQIRPLLADLQLLDLGPGAPNLGVKPLLQELERALPKIAQERDFASACLAGLWLAHGFFDESHAISQDLDTLEGSFWHGILHRREPDYLNAKYWFRRVPAHPIFAELREQAVALAGAEFRSSLGERKTWDPSAFVDLCERAAHERQDSLRRLCGEIQRCEWNLLFRYCHERAFLQ